MKKKILAVTLVLALLATALLAFGMSSQAAAATPEEKKIDAGGNFSVDPYTPINCNNDETVYGSHFATVGDSTFVGICCPSWGNDIGALTIELYAFKTSYEETLKTTPIASNEFDGFVDNHYIGFKFDPSDPLPKGEYVITLSDGFDESGNGVGFWKGGVTEAQEYFEDGNLLKGSFRLHVEYITQPEGSLWGTLTETPKEEVPINKIPHMDYMFFLNDEETIDMVLRGSSNPSMGVDLDAMEVIENYIRIYVGVSNDPQFYISVPNYIADDYLYTQDAGAMLIKMRLAEGAPTQGEVFFDTSACPGPTGGASVVQSYDATTDWQYVIFDFNSNSKYIVEDAIVENFRFDVFLSTEEETYVDIEYILFFDNYESALTWDGNFGALPTPAPTPVPTPTPEPTPVPTASPEPTKAPATEAPTTTEAPAADDTDKKGSGNSAVVIIIIAVAAVLIIGIIVAVVVIKKKK